MHQVRRGFIVDDEEEEEEDRNSDDSDRVRKRRKKKRRHRLRDIDDDNDGDRAGADLDEDDLDLLMENTGTTYRKEPSESSRQLKRLKRADDKGSRGLNDMFSDEEEEEEEEEEGVEERSRNNRRGQFSRVNEFDDFIEEDEFSDDDERGRERQVERRSAKVSAVPSRVSGLDEDKLGELYEVFGDGADYEWALEGEDEMGLPEYLSDEDAEKAGPELKDVFEPGELKERLLTDEDNLIRSKDEPERYQLLRAQLKDQYELSDEEFIEEQNWVIKKLNSEKSALFYSKPYIQVPFNKAVKKILEFITKENLEVPFIWNHRKDYLLYVRTFSKEEGAESQAHGSAPIIETLFTIDDLWRIVQLDIEFHSLLIRKKALSKMYEELDVSDTTYRELFSSATKLVDFQDLTEYLQFRYSSRLQDIAASKSTSSTKRHNRYGRFDRIRNGKLYELVRSFGITAEQFGENVESQQRLFFAEDPATAPSVLAEDFTKPLEDGTPSGYLTGAQALEAAQLMLAEELFHEPRVRRTLRSIFWEEAKVDIVLTDKGRKQIDDTSPYSDFKYAINRSFGELRLRPEVYLQMLQAESDGLVIVRISYPNYKTTLFEKLFTKYLASDAVSDTAKAWNEARRVVLKSTSRKIIPLICNNIKEDLRLDCSRALYFEVRKNFAVKLNQAPYQPKGYAAGTTARVLAMTCGMGDFSKDAVLAIVLDEDGEVIEYAKMANPRDTEFKAAFVDLVNRRTPDVVGIAGFTVNSSRFYQILKEIVEKEDLTTGGDTDATDPLDVVWVQDEVARLYQHSARSLEEFPDQVTLSRYCIGIARYLQSPMLEYAALGKEISAIPIHKYQSLLPTETFQESVDSVFVDYVNLVGVDINECIRSTYNSNVLQYVAGLGPRKASGMIQGIQNHGGTLSNRTQLIIDHITTKQIFMNCASFLRIPYDGRSVRSDETEVLDATRIHPEDYDIGRKMAADALELDEEDIAAYDNSGGVVAHLVSGEPEKLNELILEEYADELEKKFHQKKRETLEMIKAELIKHFAEKRAPLHVLTEMDVFTMLTGESAETLHNGVIIPASIRKVSDRFLVAMLACGVEGNVTASNMFDSADRPPHPSTVFSFGQTVQAVILDINYGKFIAELSTVPRDIKNAREQQKRAKHHDSRTWNMAAEDNDRVKVAVKQQEHKQGRVIKHPLFRPFNSRQAEEYLAGLSRGDVVIRPSSRGFDHIAITWKVSDLLYQHVDVLEMDKENEYTVGRILQVDNARYSDLDELIEMHIRTMARKIDEMVASDKFQNKPRSEVESWLTTYTQANPKRSTYAFCFDHKRPGYFLLLFKTGLNAPIEVWYVKVIPNGFRLFKNEYPDVVSLCNGFKTIFLSHVQARQQQHHSSRSGGGPPGSRAPPMSVYNSSGGRSGGYPGGGYSGGGSRYR